MKLNPRLRMILAALHAWLWSVQEAAVKTDEGEKAKLQTEDGGTGLSEGMWKQRLSQPRLVQDETQRVGVATALTIARAPAPLV